MSIIDDSVILREVAGNEPHTVPLIVQMLAPLVDEADIVLLGESTHGTREFYELRCEITKHLIEYHGFNVIAVEADWPDAFEIHRFVQQAVDAEPREVLSVFDRFPTWMWRNESISNFVRWLRKANARLDDFQRAGFFGLDLYSLFRSADLVVKELGIVDPAAGRLARMRYSCLEAFGRDVQGYGLAAASGLIDECEERVIQQLVELQNQVSIPSSFDSEGDSLDLRNADAQFATLQNAAVVKDAEQYYRALYRGNINTWNLRDTHMFATVQAIMSHWHRSRGARPRMVVWAHNSHIGDAQATEMREAGELNLGQLVRATYGEKSCRIGFTTYEGHVLAARGWGDPPEVRSVKPALDGSYEELLHKVELSQFFLAFRDDCPARYVLSNPRQERAIGVVYRPESERRSHYFTAQMTEQFDGIIHVDRSSALVPLDDTFQAEQAL